MSQARHGSRWTDEFQAQRELSCFGWQLVGLGVAVCNSQAQIGDFHLKVTLANLASTLLVSGFEIVGSSQRLLIVQIANPHVDEAPVSFSNPMDFLNYTSIAVKAASRNANHMLEYAKNREDWPLSRTLEYLAASLMRFRAVLRRWIKVGPSSLADLHSHLGLLRDCQLNLESSSMTVHKSFWIGNASFEPPIVRALYLSANAYLEITTIDIVSDLIVRARESDLFELCRDLAFQLSDEARHADMLATHLGTLGFDLGLTPVSLYTWALYQACETLAEKLAAQHVLQEGVGLDVSALNVRRMRDAGDELGAQLFLRITADEKNHVALGARWLDRLAGDRSNSVLSKVRRLTEIHAPPPDVPVIPELRMLAGYPPTLLAEDIASRGQLPLDRLIGNLQSP